MLHCTSDLLVQVVCRICIQDATVVLDILTAPKIVCINIKMYNKVKTF